MASGKWAFQWGAKLWVLHSPAVIRQCNRRSPAWRQDYTFAYRHNQKAGGSSVGAPLLMSFSTAWVQSVMVWNGATLQQPVSGHRVHSISYTIERGGRDFMGTWVVPRGSAWVITFWWYQPLQNRCPLFWTETLKQVLWSLKSQCPLNWPKKHQWL